MARILSFVPAGLGLAVTALTSAIAQAPPPAAPRVEPGLERAVRWKWKAAASPAGAWGLPVEVSSMPATAATPGASGRPDTPAQPPAFGRPDSYVVRKGDALILIGKRFKISVAQIKAANGLEKDTIRVGQVLRIPPEDRSAPTTPRPDAAPARGAAAESDLLTLQVLLDRAQFSAGPIDGQAGPAFQQILDLFRASYPEAGDVPALLERARAGGRETLTTYTLRPEDFRFIAPPKAVAAPPTPANARPKRRPAAADLLPPKPSFEDLTSAPLLAYRSPWEFVAERFHCQEAFLRRLNPGIGPVPPPGTTFRVPNVVPFAVEAPAAALLQPAANPQLPIQAAVTDSGRRLEITRAGNLIAALPLSPARPGLRGQGSWTILDSIPHPRLILTQEFRAGLAPTRIYGRETPTTDAPPTPTPPPREFALAPGPRNPVGVVWIHLAKAGDLAPLPYGLHGTSIPGEMAVTQSVGGLRLANWDAARAVRLLPRGTALEWKTAPPPAPAAVARPIP